MGTSYYWRALCRLAVSYIALDGGELVPLRAVISFSGFPALRVHAYRPRVITAGSITSALRLVCLNRCVETCHP